MTNYKTNPKFNTTENNYLFAIQNIADEEFLYQLTENVFLSADTTTTYNGNGDDSYCIDSGKLNLTFNYNDMKKLGDPDSEFDTAQIKLEKLVGVKMNKPLRDIRSLTYSVCILGKAAFIF